MIYSHDDSAANGVDHAITAHTHKKKNTLKQQPDQTFCAQTAKPIHVYARMLGAQATFLKLHGYRQLL